MDMAGGCALAAPVRHYSIMTVVLGYTFKNAMLAEAALRHPSLHGKRLPEGEHFERLEFLGDRVVGLAISAMLMEKFPREAEGPLTRRHTALVRAATLAAIARESGLAQQLQLAAGDSAGENMLADAMEAMMGAIFLDAGYEPTAQLVRQLWAQRLESEPSDQRDPKTRLQEWAQARGPALPVYDVIDQSGPPHAPVFRIRVTLAGGETAEASGNSKRMAEQAAAQALLNKVEKHG